MTQEEADIQRAAEIADKYGLRIASTWAIGFCACRNCQETFPITTTAGSRKLFCSRGCSDRYKYKRRKWRRAAVSHS